MKAFTTAVVPLLFTLALPQVPAAPSRPTAPVPREIAPDTYLLPGEMLPDRGPDGNTVIDCRAK